MTTTRGRKLVPRTDAERMALLDLLVNGTSTRERKDLELWWERHEIVLTIGIRQRAKRKRRRIKPAEIPVVSENSTGGEVSCPTA